MGQTSQNPFKQQLAEYTQIYTDGQNEFQVLKNPQTNQTFLVRKWTFLQDYQFQSSSQIHEQRLKINSPYLNKLLKHQGIKTVLCKDVFEHYAIWEYCQQSLGDQIEKRRAGNEYFSKKQFDNVIRSCIQAFGEIQEKNLVHKKLCIDAIRLDHNGNIKIMDPLTLTGDSNFIKILTKSETDRVYLSPEECKLLEGRKQSSNSTKNDVWTLGMVLLQLGLLQDLNNCYQSDPLKINMEKISHNLQKLGRIYGEGTKQLLSKMLVLHEEDRPSFRQIRNIQRERNANQCYLKENKNSLNGNRNSPQVFHYNQPKIKSKQVILDRNLLRQPARQNINIVYRNQNPYAPFPPLPAKLNKQNIIKNISPIYQPIVVQKIPNYQHSQLYPLSHSIYKSKISHPDTARRVSTSVSKSGLLFPEVHEHSEKSLFVQPTYVENPKPICIQQISKIAQTEYQMEMVGRSNERSRFVNQEIKKAESITYEGQLNHFVNHNNLIRYESKPKYQPLLAKIQSVNEAENIDQNEQRNILSIEKQSENQSENQLQFVIQNFKVGSKYEGQKLKNMRHGKGKFYYQDGGMYDGMWEYNKMNGHGKLYYQSGELAYDGNWKNDQFQGKGKLCNQDPEKLQQTFDYRNFDEIGEYWEFYEGDFVDDVKEGRGKLMLTNGEYFVGSFSNDMIDGLGKFFGLSGTVKGTWQKNRLMRID